MEPLAHALQLINEHDVIVCASGTSRSEVNKLISNNLLSPGLQFIDLELSENLHARLYKAAKGISKLTEKDQMELNKHLRSVGFISV